MAVPLTMSQVCKVAMLNSASQSSSSAGILNGAKVGLYTNVTTITPQTVVGDLTEPTWSGYARKSVTWNTPYASQTQGGELVGNSVLFTTPSTASESVRGAFVVASDGTTLLWVQPMDATLPIAGVSAVTFVPSVQIG